MKKILILILFIFCVNISFASSFYFALGFNSTFSGDSLFLFSKKTGTILDRLITLGNLPKLGNINFGSFSGGGMPSLGSGGVNDMLNHLGISDLDLAGAGIDKNDISGMKLDELIEKLDIAGVNTSGIDSILNNLGFDLETLQKLGIDSFGDMTSLSNDFSNPDVLRPAMNQKFSPLYSAGFEVYVQLGLGLMNTNFYYGFELAVGMNLGRTIAFYVPALNNVVGFAKYTIGVIPRLFIKYDNYWIAATLFTGFGDNSLIADPLYVGNLKGKINNPFNVLESGFRFRVLFINLETSISFSVSDLKYRDWRVGMGFEIPLWK